MYHVCVCDGKVILSLPAFSESHDLPCVHLPGDFIASIFTVLETKVLELLRSVREGETKALEETSHWLAVGLEVAAFPTYCHPSEKSEVSSSFTGLDGSSSGQKPQWHLDFPEEDLYHGGKKHSLPLFFFCTVLCGIYRSPNDLVLHVVNPAVNLDWVCVTVCVCGSKV